MSSLTCHAHRPGLRQFVDPLGVVAYTDTGRMWIAAGEPVVTGAPSANVDGGAVWRLAARFVEAAEAAGRRAAFFGATPALAASPAFRALPVGAEPVWNPQAWARTVQQHRSVREYSRKARARGVTVRWITLPAEGSALAADVPVPSLNALVARWLASRRMPPMEFVATVSLRAMRAPQRLLLAECGPAVVGLLVLSPMPHGGWVVEHFVRDPDAPPGTMDLLIDGAMRALAADGVIWASLGMAPLAGAVPWWMRLVGRVARPFYDFAGLTAFKTRLRPVAWVPALLVVPRTQSRHGALVETLRAFAGGPLREAGWRQLRHMVNQRMHVRYSLMRPGAARATFSA